MIRRQLAATGQTVSDQLSKPVLTGIMPITMVSGSHGQEQLIEVLRHLRVFEPARSHIA
jgi:hypothetical protein